jgi:hypothetical protein
MNAQTPSVVNEQAHGRWRTALFEFRAWGLRLHRLIVDRLGMQKPARHSSGIALAAAPVLAEYEGPLWQRDEAHDALVVGKIHNLRLARKRLHALEIPAGAIFSFWKQLGRAGTANGFVIGRELREGCVIPAVGGGLCQISNAIYDSAVRAGLEVVERHRHSQVLPGSLAEHDRAATVFWNYLDLRLRAPFAWRLEVELDAERLRVRIRSHAQQATVAQPIALRARTIESAGDCTNCDQTDCDSHVGPQFISRHRTWLLYDPWPEFLAMREREFGGSDRALGLPSRRGKGRFDLLFARLHAAMRTRAALWRGQPLPKARGGGLEIVAHAHTRKLRFDDLHLVVEQGLLPYLWRTGELAGRRFDVLMNALPMDAIQQRLDQPAAQHPESPTLRDFRASAGLLEAESEALAHAGCWISPHEQILALAGDRATRLDWIAPDHSPTRVVRSDGLPAILFPASALARKGVLELVASLQGLRVRVIAPFGAAESENVWADIRVERVASIDTGLALADLVVLPAWIEHQPRSLLAAIARGIPVIATAACGLPLSSQWECIPEGNVAALRRAIVQRLG